MEVTKATTATANNQSRTYGAANPVFTINYSGFVNGDTLRSIRYSLTFSRWRSNNRFTGGNVSDNRYGWSR
ncbi:MAG: hypothetical protein KF846_04670 [Cyclobacteriaceae bacterium]|nr:hypothetical protein [Cyclobacteriaceae bacterium]